MIDEKKIIFDIYQEVMEKYSDLSNEDLKDKIDELVRKTIEDTNQYVSMSAQVQMAQQIYGSIRGLGVLDTILIDESITEIMINGPKNIFVEKNGRIQELESEYSFRNEEDLMNIIGRLVEQAGRTVDRSDPICDTRLADGSRVNVVLPPLSLNGAVVTIRKFSRNPMTIEKLIEYGSINEEIAEFLRRLVKAKYNIFISGGTGSGKTTFLNALSNFIPSDERVITIEDSAELQIKHIKNLVSLETRKATVSSGDNIEIPIKDLIKASLRMRPDRIVVGEVRGEEALDMLQAMNTGHDGSLSTGHANSAKDMLLRIETMVLQGEAGLPLEAVRQQIASAIDIIVHLSRLRDKSRKTMEIVEVDRYQDGQIHLNTLYHFEEDEDSTLEKVSGKLVRTKNAMIHPDKLIQSGDYLPV